MSTTLLHSIAADLAALGVGLSSDHQAVAALTRAYDEGALDASRRWFCSRSEASGVIFALRGRTLVRFEWNEQMSMTVTIPLGRVSCVTESASATSLQVLIEIDAQDTVSAGTMSPSGEAGSTVQTRSHRATYPLAAEGAACEQLRGFSLALRNALAS